MPSLRNTIIPQIGVSNFPHLHFVGDFFYFGVDSFQFSDFRFWNLRIRNRKFYTCPAGTLEAIAVPPIPSIPVGYSLDYSIVPLFVHWI